MSLINDMLRNIEAKRPDDPARRNLQREIRALPAAPKGPGRWLKPVLLVGVPLLGIAALQAGGQLPPLFGVEPAHVAVVTQAPVAGQVAPAAPVPALAPPPAPIATVAPSPVSVQLPMADSYLRMTPMLAAMPMPAAPMLPVPDPVLPPSMANGVKTEVPVVANEPPKSAMVPAGPVKIEKSPIMATPRDRAEAEFRRAETAQAAGRGAEAIDALRAALKQDPSFVQARQALLRQLLDARQIDDAMAVLQEGLDSQPAQTGWAMSLARLQLEQNDLATADRTLARSQAYAEGNPDYAGFQGHVKTRLGTPKQALAHYQRATRLAPGEGRWWLGLGLAQEADGHLPEAREALRRAVGTGTLSAELASVAEQHLRN